MRGFLLVVIFSGACGLACAGDATPATPAQTEVKTPNAAPAQTATPQAAPPQAKPPQKLAVIAPKDAAPQMETISAQTAKPGDIISVTGVGLGAHKVDGVLLSDRKFDMQVKLLEQKDDSIKFRVPPFAKPGRVQLLVQTTGDLPKLLEQPFYLTIEPASAPAPKMAKTPEPPKPVLTAEQPPVQ